MRTKISDHSALVINTCGQNDTAEAGDDQRWTWSNPTNTAIAHQYEDIVAHSVECLWQGTKILKSQPTNIPNPACLHGNWRLHKGKAPRGAYAGPGKPLITNPGEARRKIYLPAFQNLIEHWLQNTEVKDRIKRAFNHPGLVYLRDHDTGKGIDRNGPMSHAWLLSTWLNDEAWLSAHGIS